VTEAVHCTLVVRATPAAVFALVANPYRHPDIDGSGTVRGTVTGPERLTLGARFGVAMRYWGLPYRMRNVVTELVPDQLVAWRPLSGVIWRYTLRELPGDPVRTEITETWDPAGAAVPAALGLLGFPGRSRAAMEATLRRLQQLVEQPAARQAG
jgi:hypothetical protein